MSKVLVVVDYQNDFVTGALGFEEAKELDSKIAALIREYHNNGDKVICTMDTHESDYLSTEEGKNLPILHCIKGTAGWELYGEVNKTVKELGIKCICKPTFPSKQLMNELNDFEENSNDGVSEVAICGIVTNMCVISNAVVAKMTLPNAHIKIMSDMCSSFDKDMHNKALEVMASMQMEVI